MWRLRVEHAAVMTRTTWASLVGLLCLLLGVVWLTQAEQPIVVAGLVAVDDWPQLAHDPQRSGATPQQVDAPYCFAWKWYQVPFAGRTQPVVADGRLFIGGADGVLYARDATTGAPLWSASTAGPIRHTAAVISQTVVTGSHDGFTYGFAVHNGQLRWRTFTGATMNAPLVDAMTQRVYVAANQGMVTALDAQTGALVWQYHHSAPVLTSPSLSLDHQYILLGDEQIRAFALHTSDGSLRWSVPLQGQSLAERYPVVAGETVIYRSQPLRFFHTLLQTFGDDVMDQAGTRQADWAADWAAVRPQIVAHLTANPDQQTLFVLNVANGQSRGVVPVLYTFGNQDTPAAPAVSDTTVIVPYRARHGIQTDSATAVHVSSRYDAELGQLDLTSLDLQGLRSVDPFQYQFRLTSDEPGVVTIGGSVVWVDNWERLGGLKLDTGQLVYAAHVSNSWPECFVECGIAGSLPFFPLTAGQPAYPFPAPRLAEGHQRSGAVIANQMVYWKVIEGGIGALRHQAEASCPTPHVWGPTTTLQTASTPAPRWLAASRTLTDYLTLDLTVPVVDPPADLVARLRAELDQLVSANDHLMPFYLERGFSSPALWPPDVPPDKTGPPQVSYNSHGNSYWHDPSELLLSMAQAYPYLDAPLQTRLKAYMAEELVRYPLLDDLPYGDPNRDWLRAGVAREGYVVPFRSQLNNWPPPATPLSALYSLWLWSKQTGDWSYAQSHWVQAKQLYAARSAQLDDYYADLAGVIGYVRLANQFGDLVAAAEGTQAALAMMEVGRDLEPRINLANQRYLDPREQPTGYSMPVFFGMVPEVGRYLSEQTNGAALRYINRQEWGEGPVPIGMRWWYLTRAGAHAEVGETSFLAPTAAWAHFLAHAYILGDHRETLRVWLDRPWGRGDLFSIQKIVATIQAPSTMERFVYVPFAQR